MQWTQTQHRRSLTLHARGNTAASTSGGNRHLLCNLCPSWCKCFRPCKRQQMRWMVWVLLLICAREQSLPAYCMIYMAPCTSLKISSFQNSWIPESVQSPSPACAYKLLLMLSTYCLHFGHVAEQISPPFLFCFNLCSSFTMWNFSGCKYWQGMFHYRGGFNYLLDVSLIEDAEE